MSEISATTSALRISFNRFAPVAERLFSRSAW
jgi:hypothetical protein